MTSEQKNPHILQIIPAADWYAIFNDLDTGEQYYDPLVCWALTVDDGSQAVQGMVALENRVVPCERDPQFSHYAHQEDLDLAASQAGEPP